MVLGWGQIVLFWLFFEEVIWLKLIVFLKLVMGYSVMVFCKKVFFIIGVVNFVEVVVFY